jgi:glutathione S-transferase
VGARLQAHCPPSPLTPSGPAFPKGQGSYRRLWHHAGAHSRWPLYRRLHADHRRNRGSLPQPPLYPEDEADRRRALELEEFFDEQLGPHIRRAAYEELLAHPDMVVPLLTHGQPLAARMLVRATFPVLRAGMRRTLEINPAAAEASREKTVAAIDRLEEEIGPSGYLVGDSFTVADLAAAVLLSPVVRPPEFPYPSVTEAPDSARAFLDPLARRAGGQWVTEMYRRHRNISPGPAPARVPISG